VRELCQSFNEPEVPNIYLLDSAEGNAFVVNVDLLDFVKPWNAVYVSPYVLHTCEREELQALMAHEMCHFSLHATFWGRFFYLQPVVFAVWTTVVMAYPMEWLWQQTHGGLNFWLGLVILGLFGIVRWIWLFAVFVARLVTTFVVRPDSQEIESLCDYEAALRFGILPMINALLKMGTRQEIFAALLARLSPDETDPFRLPGRRSFSMGSTTRSRIQGKHPAYLRAKERLIADGEEYDETPRVPTEEEIKEAMMHERSEAIAKAYEYLANRLPKGFVSLEESQHLIEEAIEAASADRFDHQPRKMVRWLDFDHLIPNARIDEEEYRTFVDSLRHHPDAPLFYIPEEYTPELASQAEHPTLRHRILFLDFHATTEDLPLFVHRESNASTTS
jgi:Zn-dependent protease with chaperone function